MSIRGMSFSFADKFNYESPFSPAGSPQGATGFYTGSIDFQKLCERIVASKGGVFEYNYEDYLSNKTEYYTPPPGAMFSPPVSVHTYLTVTDLQGITHQVISFGRLNKKQGMVKVRGFHDVCNVVTVDGEDEKLRFKKFFYYDGAPGCSNNEDDLAFEIECIDTTSYLKLSEYLGFYSDDNIKKQFTKAFDAARESKATLNYLYKNAPDYVIATRTDPVLWKDLQLLLNYDKSSWFKDASNAMVKILMGFNDLKGMYATLEKDPTLVLDLYDFINGKQVGVYCTFLDILSKLCASPERLSRKFIRIPYGSNIELDSDLFFDAKKGVVNIRAYQVSYSGFYDNGMGGVGQDKEKSLVLDIPDLHPLDIIQLHDATTGKSQNVPAIYVKYLSDQAEWARVIEMITISLDIITILISAGALAAGARGLIFLLSVADIGLATTDLLLKIDEVKAYLNQTEGGKWFVEHWNEIYGIAGVLMLSPMIVNGIIQRGPALINFLLKQGVKQATEFADLIRRLILNLKVELYIAAYNKIVLCSFEPFSIVAQLLGNGIARSMEEVGLLLGKLSESEVRVILYNGVKVAEGDINELKTVLADIFKRRGSELVKYLEELISKSRRLYRAANDADRVLINSLRKKFGAKITKNIAKCIGEIGGQKIDLEVVSGSIKNGQWQNKGNFIPPNPSEYVYKPNPLGYIEHTEQKVIEYLRKKFEFNKDIAGRIELISERSFCDNCNWIVDQFQKEFLNIEIVRVEVGLTK